jgi:UDP-hydrolysing UDP-N-acetyl-D-glucosamine 2-epimerase
MTRFVGALIIKLTDKLKEINPDAILLLGDRGEMLAGAIVGAYLGIPLVHVHGGEVSSTVDDSCRHAITKLSHIHLPATRKSAERIIKMGESKENVFVVGAPGLDSILHEELIESKKIIQMYGLEVSRPIFIVVQHPVSMEINQAPYQMQQTLDAILELKVQKILIYPNADAAGREMIEVIRKYENIPYIKAYRNIPRKEYLSLLNVASVLIGNSSSGIIEAASFKLPVVNIGSRQMGRERAENVIDSEYSKEKIISKILKCLNDQNFKQKVKNCKNPYGKGRTGEKIAEVLCNVNLDKKLLQKKMSY